MEDHRNPNVSCRSSRCPALSPGPSHHSSIPTRSSKHLRHHAARTQTICQQLLLLLMFLTCYISLSSASPTLYIDEQLVEVEARSDAAEPLGSTFDRLARSGTILVDPNPPPPEANANVWPQVLAAADLKRRSETESSSASTTATVKVTTTIKKSSSSSTLAPTSTSSGIAAAETTSVGTLPTPFDMGFNNNITANCAAFMASMLSNTTFQQCLPFSLLLQVRRSIHRTLYSS